MLGILVKARLYTLMLKRKFIFLKIGDSIVRKARETLERAIDLVNNTPRWGARVVYGDTDR